jgi:hypothetical protein
MKTILKQRRGQIWEWITDPVERYYIVKSWLGEHPADGMPVTYHEMINLNNGVLVEQYMEHVLFETLSTGNVPEMNRLL